MCLFIQEYRDIWFYALDTIFVMLVIFSRTLKNTSTITVETKGSYILEHQDYSAFSHEPFFCVCEDLYTVYRHLIPLLCILLQRTMQIDLDLKLHMVDVCTAATTR